MARNRAYKRTWRNLLLNKRYQLRFTLFMVGLSAILMGLLGWWVMNVAASATTLAVNNTLTACQDLPGAPGAALPASASPAEPSRPRPVVTIDDSGMQPAPPAPAEPPGADPGPPEAPQAEGRPAAPIGPSEAELAAFRRCEAAVPAKVKRLEDRQRLIFWVLIASGALLAFGLLLYGIKMTHRVAGPLHKVTLYMGKLRGGVYDPVYNLRKGDHLVEFYEHFKAAHAGLRGLQEEDARRLRSLLAAADQAELAAVSPALAESIEELRGMLERKEKSLV
jgi:hypothetical protein